MKTTAITLGKLALCGMGLFAGLRITGLWLPVGADAGAFEVRFFLVCLVLALVLSFISRGLQINWLVRWAILAVLTWVFGVVGVVVESLFFMKAGVAASLLYAMLTLTSFLLPGLLLSLLVAVLFQPEPPFASFQDCLRICFASHTKAGLLGRFAAALLAYPLAYIIFGLLVQPLIQDGSAAGMTGPLGGAWISLQLLRSLLFLMASLPVVIWWRGSRTALWLALGIAVFFLTAFMAALNADPFPWTVRLFQWAELLAVGLAYASALALLFGRNQNRGVAAAGV